MDYNRFEQAENNFGGMDGKERKLSKRGLFSDTTKDYLIPPEPAAYSEVKVRFRSLKNNIDRVFFVHNGQKYLMNKIESGLQFDFYGHVLLLDNVRVSYYFEIQLGNEVCYYDNRGVAYHADGYYNFGIMPGFQTPQWAKGAVFYQIYVDRFCNGDTSNDVLTNEYQYIGDKSIRVEDWNKYPATMGVREFYGGDLQGVLDKMDYLKDLGIDAIYFNPLFVSPSNHKYDIQDYDYIDPHFGKIVYDEGEVLADNQKENRYATRYINRVTNKLNLEASNALFAKVVEEAHKRNIKVILDGVFNHCGSFNKWIDRERIYENAEGYEKGAFVEKDSPYQKYFQFFNKENWPYNSNYDGWWGHDTLPKLNYEESKELYDYILYIGKKWVSPPFNADGWRLDVAADLGHTPEFNHQFWKDFRKAVKSANPDAIILAEHYGNPSEWIQGNEWDTVMNYDAFMEPVTWFLTGMQKHSDDFRGDMLGNAGSFWGAMRHHSTPFLNSSLQVAMNELSNHDHSRFLTRTNRRVGRTNNLGPQAANENINVAVMREAVLMQMTWPGAPTIYYGDEAGVCGFTDPDNRRTYPWGNENQELIDFHKEIIRIHKENPEFIDGSIKYMVEEYNIVGYGRISGEESSAVLINNNEYEITKDLQVWDLGIPWDREVFMTRIMFTTKGGYDTTPLDYLVQQGKTTVILPPFSGIILKYKKKVEKKFLQFI